MIKTIKNAKVHTNSNLINFIVICVPPLIFILQNLIDITMFAVEKGMEEPGGDARCRRYYF